MNDYHLRIPLLILIFSTSYLAAHSQKRTSWYKPDQSLWPSAMSGGFLAPQFSTFDLDLDGSEELITMDRFSGIIQTWSWEENDISYRLCDNVRIDWPELSSWMLVRDFNNDSIPDVFTQGLNGIAVYKGLKDGLGIIFEKMGGEFFIDDSLIFRNKTGSTTNIYHAGSDIPIIEDIDGDGDLDIMSFELSGSYLYLYENQWDKSGEPLDFMLKHKCWGYFAENQFSDDINLANNQLDCPPPFAVRHSGSTSCLIDVNHDSMPDLLLGDVGGNSLKVLINQGPANDGYITEVNPVFPDHHSPAILHYFPAAYNIDINQDGLSDVVVATNDYPLTDYEGVWAYTGTHDTSQLFKLQTDHWLSDEYIDFGQYATPHFIKINGDELTDLLISYQVSENAGRPKNRIAYFEALSDREFQLRDLDFGTLSEELSIGYRPYLTSGDVDNDGDLDILAGMSSGNCYLILNNSGVANTFEVDKIELKWAGLELLYGATPEFYDIDGDGDLDVITGSDNGTIALYVNIGDKNGAAFDADLDHFPNIKGVGQIRTISVNSLLGRSAPRIMNNGTDTILISGSQDGKIYTYRINTNELTSKFDQIVLDGWPQWSGSNSRIAIDPDPESEESRLIIGNIAGGLQEYLVSRIMTSSQELVQYPLELYPNPVKSGQELKLSLDHSFQINRINIFFPNGVIAHSVTPIGQKIQLSTSGFLPGIYVLQIILEDDSTIIRKLVFQ